jgi:hypothetical protein
MKTTEDQKKANRIKREKQKVVYFIVSDSDNNKPIRLPDGISRRVAEKIMKNEMSFWARFVKSCVVTKSNKTLQRDLKKFGEGELMCRYDENGNSVW